MVRQYFVSRVSSVAVGAAVGFGSVFGAWGLPNFAQNSVALRPDASIARRQTSAAVVLAAALSIAAVYFAMQYFASASGSAVGFGVSLFGSVLGAKRAQNSVGVSADASIAWRQGPGGGAP